MKLENVTQINEHHGPEMTDEQFEQLKQEIVETTKKLETLQRAYRMQTGQDYRPFR